MTRKEMTELLTKTMSNLRLWNEINSFTDESEAVVPNPPASRKSLEDLISVVGFDLPPSYLQLLSIHDGIKNFYSHGMGGELLPSSYRFEYNTQWQDCVNNLSNVPELNNLFFIAIDNDGSVVAFDCKKANTNREMEVIEIINYREIKRYNSLPAFLVQFSAMIEGWVKKEDEKK